MKKLSAIVSVVASFVASGVAQAALLEDIYGGVWINRGSGFVAVRGATEVKPGDLVMIATKGRSRLVYPDGCVVSVPSGSVTAVGATSPCKRGAGTIEGPEAAGGIDTTALLGGGGVALAAATSAVVAATSGGRGSGTPPFIIPRPASP